MDRLTSEHRNYLNDSGITDAVLEAAGVHSTTEGGRNQDMSGIVFPYRWDGEEVLNLRPDEPRKDEKGRAVKYEWPANVPSIFTQVRTVFGDGPVIVVEGTKQALAVASWAPDEYSVIGMNGCWGWTKKDLSWFADRNIFLVFDGDAADNADVYSAASKFKEELEMEDATVKFVRLPVEGKDGADDYLAGLPEEKRTLRLSKLIAKASPKPADRKPAQKSGAVRDDGGLPELDGRIGVKVNQDRLTVINQILGALKERQDGRTLFDFGGALTSLKDHVATPLTNGAFLMTMAQNVATFNHFEATQSRPAKFEPTWPDSQTVQAVMSASSQFSVLERVARVPFIRKDGSLCAKEGYDSESRAFLILGPGMDRVSVPEEPTQVDAYAAAEFLLNEWLGNMLFHSQSDRANCLALILTPFIRSMVSVVPMAILNGLQPSVGKGLTADILTCLITGEAEANLVPFVPDEDEMRKQITAQMQHARDFFMFDEVERIESKQLSRALTSPIYQDRVLGSSRMIVTPNRATWMALGNGIQVSNDMARRVYYILLHPTEANPQDRDNAMFRHPDLKQWTRDNRPELVSAALTMIRAWMAAGKPRGVRTSRMGSFETWDEMMDGVLTYARVDGFLADLVTRRADNDFFAQEWTSHMVWLTDKFREEEFTCKGVWQKGSGDPDFEAPPKMEDLDVTGWTRELGKQYAKMADRWWTAYDGRLVRLVASGLGHGGTRKWSMQTKDVSVPGDRSKEPGGGMVVGSVVSAPTPMYEKKGVYVGARMTHVYEGVAGTVPSHPTHPTVDPFTVPAPREIKEAQTQESPDFAPKLYGSGIDDIFGEN